MILIVLGIVQGCYDNNSNNDIKVAEEIHSSIIAEQANAQNTYANCIATIPTNLKGSIEAKAKSECDQNYKNAWSKTIRGDE